MEVAKNDLNQYAYQYAFYIVNRTLWGDIILPTMYSTNIYHHIMILVYSKLDAKYQTSPILLIATTI